MGSLFRLRLLGDDEEHLVAVAEAALDEISRVERLLSWRDPRSEAARINRLAATEPVLVDFEMAEILATCATANLATDGYFDIAHGSRRRDVWKIDATNRLVRLYEPDVQLDFGAFGKGYALERAAVELRRYGVMRGLLDGGTSSVLALGCDEAGKPWPVGLRDPFVVHAAANPEPVEVSQLMLSDSALSCSATFEAGAATTGNAATSDIIDPHDGRPPAELAGCAVVAKSAATAEILSTALVCMGRLRATAYTDLNKASAAARRLLDDVVSIDWLEPAPPAADARSAPTMARLFLCPPGVST